ncbi:MAG: LapA family protein [Desulfobacterales bacterium]|jgi:uncharacterized integral membrane protein
MGSYFKALLLLIVLVVLVTFGIENKETMTLHYYFQLSSMPVPVYAVVYGSLVIGVFIGMIVGISARFSQRKKIKQLQKENRSLRNKIPEPAEEKTPEEEKTPAEEKADEKRDASLDETRDVSLDETQVIQKESEEEIK